MINTMTCEGHTARIEYDDADGIFTGRIIGISDRVGFHADTVRGLRAAFREAVEDYLDTCAGIGKEPQESFSGEILLRISPDIHRRVALAAERSGGDLDRWIEDALNRAVEWA